jgi:hypothetical protein
MPSTRFSAPLAAGTLADMTRHPVLFVATAAVISAIVAGAAAAPAGAHAGPPKLLSRTGRHWLAVRPAVVNYSNDGSGAFGGSGGRNGTTDPGRLRWSSWTRTRAVGHGVDWVKSCTPDCAAGHWHRHRATLTATDARNGVFRRLTDRERDGRRAITIRWTIARLQGTWQFVQPR